MSKSTAAESIRRLAVQYQDMVLAADVLDKIGSLEGAVAEISRDTELARAELSRVNGELAKAQADVAEAKSAAQGVLDRAELDALAKAAAAEASAADIEDRARTEAAGVVDAARAEAQSFLDQANGLLTAVRSELVAQENAVVEAESRRTAAESAAADAEAKLKAVREQINLLASA